MSIETMDIFLVLLVVFGILNAFVNGISIANYVKTLTRVENPNCEYDDVFNAKLKQIPNISLIGCGIRCTTHPKCRRFMYNKQSRICTLYQSGENCIAENGLAQNSVCYRQKAVCNELICTRCPMGHYGDDCENIIKDCSDGAAKGVVPQIKTLSYIQPTGTYILQVKCEFDHGGFTHIQHRTSDCSDIDYNRTWNEYSDGFGDASGNYWLGLKHVYNILQNNPSNLLMVYVEGYTSWHLCYYFNFAIHDESYKYRIITGQFIPANSVENGMSDVFTRTGYDINNRTFSTIDDDDSSGCATDRQAGWWYLSYPTCSPVKFNEDEIQWIDLNNTVTNYRKLHLRLKGQS